jgi:predicted nicotinamide N-methyase
MRKTGDRPVDGHNPGRDANGSPGRAAGDVRVPGRIIRRAGGNDLEVRVGRRTVVIRRSCDLEALWEALGSQEFGEDERIPYWAEIWPASLLLAQWLAARDLSGARCLDVGCGLGLTAVAGAMSGGRVLGLDYAWEAVAHAAANAQANGVSCGAVAGPTAGSADFALMDWRAPGLSRGCADLAWAGDVFYEKRFTASLDAFFCRILAPGGRLWVGEAEREVSEGVWDQLAASGWTVCRAMHEEIPTLEGRARVNIWELTRG